MVKNTFKYDLKLFELNIIMVNFFTRTIDIQGCNARKVISEVYASFVLQCKNYQNLMLLTSSDTKQH